MLSINDLINKKYRIVTKIGGGSFGSIYEGINIRTDEQVAIKVEPHNMETKLLKNETNMYQYLAELACIPNVKWFGKDDHNNYMVINLLGSSLQSKKTMSSTNSFSLLLTLQIGIKILCIIELIHKKGIIHRDIKPDNFLLDSVTSKNTSNIYLIDFGFAKSFISNETNKHILERKTAGLIGSNTYASLNAHNCCELSRRDDLESIGYMLLYFYLGDLPWTKTKDKIAIIQLKQDITNSKINKNEIIPQIFIDFITYSIQLGFEEEPEYNKWKLLFREQIIAFNN
jgi:serine/threonine protein kinase